MSSPVTGREIGQTPNPVPLWAILTLILQAIVFFTAVSSRAGAIEARITASEQSIERNRSTLSDGQEKYVKIIERLTKIESKQDQLLEAVQRPKH